MSIVLLICIGIFTGATTVLFGFGGGFVTVPVILWVSAAAGPNAATIAVATSAVVMVVNACIATIATPREILCRLHGTTPLLILLAVGGAVGAIAATHAPEQAIAIGFAVYLGVTILDAVIRPGFLRPANTRTLTPKPETEFAIRPALGLPIGALAAFLGVGGSVMTVPLLRRSGLPMRIAAALANPLTLCVAVPAGAVFLLASGSGPSPETAGIWLIGTVDLGAAALLLIGSVPVVVLWRRRPPRIPDRVHAWGYIALLIAVLIAILMQIA